MTEQQITQKNKTSISINQKSIEAELLKELSKFYSGDANKYIKSIMIEMEKSKSDKAKNLFDCTPLSIVTSVKKAIDLGLEIDGRGNGHLVKRSVNVGTKNSPNFINECVFQIGYAGFIYAIKRALPDANIVVNLVKEGDILQISKSCDIEEYSHKVNDPFAGEDKIIGAYCYISFTLDGKKIAKIETMSKNEIDKIKSCAKTDFIWQKWYGEKAKVAVIRRACKILFAGLNNENLNKIIEKDDEDYNLEEIKEEPKIIENLPVIDFEEENNKVEVVFINEEQQEQIKVLANQKGVSLGDICKYYQVDSLSKIPNNLLDEIISILSKKQDVNNEEIDVKVEELKLAKEGE